MSSIENLPSHKPISEANAAHEAAQADHLTKRRDVTQLEQERPASEWRQAQAISEARAAGKPDPRQSFVDEHDRLIDKARIELKVSTLAEQKAHEAMEAARGEHEPTYRVEVEALAADLDAQWDSAVRDLARLHAERRHAVGVAKELGSDHLGVGSFPVDCRKQLGMELARDAQPVGRLSAEDALAGLANLGQPDPEPEPFGIHPLQQVHAQRDIGVDNEREEREEREAHYARKRSAADDRIQQLAADVAST